jgi:hypothetical protein
MDLYTFSLLLGGAGLAAMGFKGLAPRIGSGHGHHHGHHHGPLKHVGHGRASIRSFLSPRVIFSVLLGVGLTGLLLDNLVGGLLLLALSLAGGLLFETFAIAPLWNFLLRFASAPALTLESCVTDDATAVTTFDSRGHGLIAVELDGQVIQVLGTLKPTDRAAGLRVRAGDRVRIEEVDAARNRCTVSVP